MTVIHERMLKYKDDFKVYTDKLKITSLSDMANLVSSVYKKEINKDRRKQLASLVYYFYDSIA